MKMVTYVYLRITKEQEYFNGAAYRKYKENSAKKMVTYVYLRITKQQEYL